MARAEAALEDGIEAVTIYTPNWIHAEMARTFLAGVDVILDKPMTTRTEDARMLLRLARELDRKIVMTYPYAHHAMAHQARAMIANGAIGTVRQLLCGVSPGVEHRARGLRRSHLAPGSG